MRDAVASRATELTRGRVPFVQATVVRAQHPTSAHAGDVALIHEDGRIEGFVGGSCAETSVREYGLRAISTKEPILLRIVPGTVPGPSDEGAVTVANPCLSGGTLEIFLEPRLPAPHIVVVGDSPVGRALLALAEPLGFAAEPADGEDAAPRQDDAALIVASHGRGEEPALTAALLAGVPYVALVASRTRGAAVLASLDVDEELRRRVHSPAGLDVGARTAPEIALSILAELVAERSRRQPELVVTRTALDPVCGMTVPMVDAAPHLDLEGRRLWFCGTGCRDAFAAAPERYAVGL
ncbi:MAG: Xanthine dehydrogenase accessory factor [Frankiales bacterium]|nr:Xanthine dehydrogenase accessory factor [Frankiales bacterium]